jgi:hypothetical protein
MTFYSGDLDLCYLPWLNRKTRAGLFVDWHGQSHQTNDDKDLTLIEVHLHGSDD